jgi:hypothetical protein
LEVLVPNKTILVTGDFVLDFQIYEGQRHHYGQNLPVGVKVKHQLGGAALVHQVLEALLKLKRPEPEWQSFMAVQDEFQDGALHSFDPSKCAYAFWRPYPKDKPPEKQFWRVGEAMGFGGGNIERAAFDWKPARGLPDSPQIVVLSEGGMDFRESRDLWHDEKLKSAKWIFLKTAAPVGEGALWRHLSENYNDKLVVVIAARELRETPARLNIGLSWESNVEDALRELDVHGSLSELMACRHLIIAFDSEGALWLERGSCLKNEQPSLANTRARLVYDAGAIEGDNEYETQGKCFGFLSCLTASLAWQATVNLDEPNFAAAIEGGLAAIQNIREQGHGAAYETPLGFPVDRLAGVVKGPPNSYSLATFGCFHSSGLNSSGTEIPIPPGKWTLLSEAQRGNGPAYGLARLVLLRGPIALKNLPHLRVGNLLSVDRSDIEALRTVIQVLRQYKDDGAAKRPLSIGVFGPPGSGKSFAVRELAANTVGKEGWMEFNLSQFNTVDDLIGAFHQIRDQVLMGRLPVAFFDEFDSQRFKWLQYLLAPMQDGKFQEGQLTHSLGKCVFVLAGGTSWTFKTFGPLRPAMRSADVHDAYRDFQLAKGPDFQSRLDTYLDVVGPNPRNICPPEGTSADQVVDVSGYQFGQDPTDIYFPIRRALMIRANLKCAPDDKLDIDEGLEYALLRARNYVHGSRSLEKVLQPFLGARHERLHRSLLMPETQLDMHTDAEKFLKLCSEAPVPISPTSVMTQGRVALIAPAIHETWRALGKKGGWQKPELDVDFDQLPGNGDDREFYRDSNRAAAWRMLKILDLADLQLLEGFASPEEETAIRQHMEYRVEALAEAEHEGWMAWYLSRGWRYGPKREEDRRIHNCLVPYSQLRKSDADKDRDSIRHYPDFARAAGLKIAFA